MFSAQPRACSGRLTPRAEAHNVRRLAHENRSGPWRLHRSEYGSITGVLFVSTGAEAFPEEAWRDFPVVVLGWWIRARQQLTTNGTGIFLFMDGPYEFRARRAEALINVELVELTAQGKRVLQDISGVFDEFAASLETAAQEIVAACRERGWSDTDIETLERAVNPPPNQGLKRTPGGAA